MSFKIIWSTDWHLADSPPAMRIDEYTETAFKKVAQLRTFCEKTGADICLIGGDVFHVKTSSKVRHALVARVIKELQKFPCPVWSIVGNHDISHNNLITLPEKPLGVVFNSGALHMLQDEVFVSKDGVRVRIIGQHFDPKIGPGHFDTLKKGEEDWLLAAYHGYANLNGESYPGEFTFKYEDLSPLAPDDWYLGHWHIDQGVEEIDDKNFVNVGALMRGALNLENISRKPKAVLAVYTKTARRIVELPLVVQPSNEVFDLRKKERTDREHVLINNFIENLRTEAAAPDDTENEVALRVKGLTLETKVRSKVISLLEEAEVTLEALRTGK